MTAVAASSIADAEEPFGIGPVFLFVSVSVSVSTAQFQPPKPELGLSVTISASHGSSPRPLLCSGGGAYPSVVA